MARTETTASLNPLSLRAIRFGVGYLFRHPLKFMPRLQLKLRQIINGDYPQLADGAVRFMNSELKKITAPAIAEWGSGRSTLWFSTRAARLVSVEHNAAWHNLIKDKLKRRNSHHVTLTLARENGPEYPNSILPGAPYDLILIDGIRRAECAAIAVKTIKPGGIIVVDNSNRPEYSCFMSALGTEIGTYVSNATTTTIFRATKD